MEKQSELSATINLEPDQEITQIYENHCLIGKILLNRPLDQTLVKISTHREWQCKNGLAVSQISRNLFMFIFQDKQDLANVVQNQPWTIMGGLLMLSACVSGQVPRELKFSYSPFWAQAHGLPMDYLTTRNGPKIGQLLGEFVCTDWEIVRCGKFSYSKFLRLRVVLDVRKPIKTGFWLKRAGLKDIWIDFKYEKLGLFCYKCGLIGYSYRTCNCKFPSGDDAKFGPWLRADSWEPGSVPDACIPTAVDTDFDPNVCATLLAVPKVVQSPNLGDIAFELASVSMDCEETQHEAETEITHNRRKMWRRLIFNSIDSAIMLANCGVVFWRMKSLDESDGNWNLFILMAAYLCNLLRKLVFVRRGLKLNESRNGMVPSGDGTNYGRAVAEILILVLFLVILISF